LDRGNTAYTLHVTEEREGRRLPRAILRSVRVKKRKSLNHRASYLRGPLASSGSTRSNRGPPNGIPDFRPPPKIPKYVDTSEALDHVVEYDLIDPIFDA
jgi:hypothetical protein